MEKIREVLFERQLQTAHKREILDNIRRLQESLQEADAGLGIGERNV